MSEQPNAWDDLMEALLILRKHAADEVSPFHCGHDELTVMSDPTKYNAETLDKLRRLGFFADQDWGGGVFKSFRFGSA